MTIEKLRYEAGRHRGLWIGMFPEPSEELTDARRALVERNVGALIEIKALADMHVTIFHLGKNNSSSTVESVVAAVEMSSSIVTGDRRIGVEGYLRFPRHVGLAVVPDDIVTVRRVLGGCLRDRGIAPDDRFAGLPHMTIGKIGRTVQRLNDSDADILCPGVRSFSGLFRGLTVICGDASLVVPFGDGVF